MNSKEEKKKICGNHDLQSSDCVGIEYRLDSGLFNLRRLQTKTKTFSAVISALQYADDAAFLSLTPTEFNVVLVSCLKLTSVQAL